MSSVDQSGAGGSEEADGSAWVVEPVYVVVPVRSAWLPGVDYVAIWRAGQAFEGLRREASTEDAAG